MRKKGGLLLLIMFVMMSSNVVRADEIFERTGMSLFTGGWKQEIIDGRHWTSYQINAPVSVTAYISVNGYSTEGRTAMRKASITSKHKTGPYHGHRHSYHTP